MELQDSKILSGKCTTENTEETLNANVTHWITFEFGGHVEWYCDWSLTFLADAKLAFPANDGSAASAQHRAYGLPDLGPGGAELV